jgi:hypothetical protein
MRCRVPPADDGEVLLAERIVGRGPPELHPA